MTPGHAVTPIRVLAGLAVLALLAAWRPVPPTEGASFRVGTFNIRYDNAGDGANAWRHRRERVLEVLRESEIWGLQEALPSQIADLRKGLAGYGVVARTREADPTRGEACPIVYRLDRWTLDPEDHGTFWLSETPEEAGSRGWDAALSRIATWARLLDGEGRAVYVFNTHFDHRGEKARRESAKVLCARIAARRHPDPVVVLGDLNTGPGSPPIETILAGDRPALVDAWRAVKPDRAEQPTFNGWAEACAGARIDWVFLSPGLEPVDCVIDLRKPGGRWPSDHAPVVATVRRRADSSTVSPAPPDEAPPTLPTTTAGSRPHGR